MSQSHTVTGSTSLPQLNQLLDRFEEAWRRGTVPRIDDILSSLPPAAGEAARQELLEELIAVDLEYRWRSLPTERVPGTDLPPRPLLEDYYRCYPQLGLGNRPLHELIGAEYRVRQRWGDRPDHATYAARFPQHGPSLGTVLRRIDRDLLDEFGVPASTEHAPNNSAPVLSVDALLETLRRHALVAPAPLDELARLAAGDADVRTLARTILEHDWLTAYQVNQLLQGRGADLVLGPYLILERLGEGGSGQVFKARHLRLDRVVALKVIRRELLTDAEVVRRFQREIQVTAQLDHPNIIRAYDAGLVGSTYVLAMEYVEGIDLARLIKRSGPLPVDRASAYIRQAALGLQHAHERGLVHRDIKPNNLLVTGTLAQTTGALLRTAPQVKIVDLGLARLQKATGQEATSLVTPQDQLMGTPDYMAPEQALNFHSADTRADVYSLGCTLFYLLTGRPPFPAGMLAEKLLQHQQMSPPDLRKLRPDVPPGLPRVLSKCLAKRPKDRYQTPGALAEALAALERPGVVPRWLESCWQRKRIAGAALLLLGALALIGWGKQNESEPRQGHPTEPSAWTLDQLDGGASVAEERSVLKVEQLVAIWGSPPWRPWGPVTSLAFGPDGELATVGRDSTIRVWQAETGEVRVTLRTEASLLSRVALAPDGRTLASVPLYGTAAHLWDVPRRAVRATLGGHGSTVLCVAFSTDGKTVATGSRDNTVKLWDGITGKELATLAGHTGAVTGVSFAPGAPVLASASEDRTVKLWDLTGKREPNTLAGHSAAVTAVAFAPGGKRLASGGEDNSVVLWDVEQVKDPVVLGKHSGHVRSVAFSADGTLLASGSDDSTVILWEVDRKRKRTTLEGHAGKVQCVSFAPRGSLLASAADDETVKLWDATAGEEQPSPLAQTLPISCMAFAPDGQTLYIGQDKVIQRWHLATGKTLSPLRGHLGKVRCLSLSRDGASLATGSDDRSIKLWEPAGGTLAGTLQGHTGAINAVAFDYGGRTIASGSDDRTVKLWNLPEKKERMTLRGYQHPILSLAFAPVGESLAVGCWDTVKVCDATDGVERWAHPSESKALQLAFSAEGRTLAINAQLFDFIERRAVDHSPAAKSSELTALVFNPLSRELIAGRHPGHLDRWDLARERWQSISTLPGNAHFLALARDGRHLAVASGNGTVFVLRLAPAPGTR